MATNGKQKSDVERIREVIRLLNRALRNCTKLLVEAKASVQLSGQDNEPRLKRPSA